MTGIGGLSPTVASTSVLLSNHFYLDIDDEEGEDDDGDGTMVPDNASDRTAVHPIRKLDTFVGMFTCFPPAQYDVAPI